MSSQPLPRVLWRGAASAAAVVLAMAAMAHIAGVFPRAGAYRLTRPDKQLLTFRQSAQGAAMRPQPMVTRVAVASTGGMGLIVAAAICPEEAFLLDRQRALVHRVDLVRSEIVAQLRDDAEGGFSTPTGIAADCDARRVYVVDGSGVIVFHADSGAILRRFAKPKRFANSVGPAVLDVAARQLYAPGLWTTSANDWQTKTVQRFFEKSGIGYRLDLDTGATRPLVSAVEPGCWSLGPNCVFAVMDRLRVPGGGWVAAHRVGALVGVFDAAAQPVRTIDVRSPMFLENGEQNGSTALERMVAWNESNSVIRGVFSFGDVIATVHTFNRTIDWKPGQPTDFEVFLNLHSVDGEGLLSDVRLPGIPVGRDETSLYVVDYGPVGRRAMGNDPIALIRVAVRAE